MASIPLRALPLAVLLVAGGAHADSQLMEMAKGSFEPIPEPPANVDGVKVTDDMVILGKKLFFDPRLSGSQTISCNTCHNLGMGGDDNQPTSLGHGWQRGPRNAPTVFNAVYNVAQFWDGRASDLKEQAKGPIQAGVEMHNTPKRVVETIKSMDPYVEDFEAAFPDQSDPVTFDNVAAAIQAYEATLLTPDAPFDRYLKGDEDALSDHQKEGLQAFMNKGCVACHNGINVGGQGYYPFGLVEKPGADVLPENDKGRFSVTGTATDEYVFRAPSLRNVAVTEPYFHSGQVWDLTQAVAIMGEAQLGQELSDKEVSAITAFLESLTGPMPDVSYPQLPPNGANTPRPLEAPAPTRNPQG
ncbi:Cytochrome c551 peroxidase [wastewater metagenome]|uniref:Cytochrome c551 peroxidase n=2 Tax=unclassified sequences TaxID=12908 RepID=A0A5B8RBM7_9ZZZZ|nr:MULTISPECIES: cytochrome-c peroxidase [Arhodomonas]MCS4503052.1 cytochrome-c peroxidase [Arhodomonas aquaeolei]QEA06041.1 cytochrome c551 peroxidase [uncultured organism]